MTIRNGNTATLKQAASLNEPWSAKFSALVIPQPGHSKLKRTLWIH